MELDNENNRIVFLRESDPFMPILPSPERQEEFLEEGLKTPPSTPIHSPHAFLKEDRWLFSPPPVLTLENTHLDESETRTDATPHDTDKDQNSKMLKKRVVRPSSLILLSWPENQGILFFLYISQTLQMNRISFMASLLNAVL